MPMQRICASVQTSIQADVSGYFRIPCRVNTSKEGCSSVWVRLSML